MILKEIKLSDGQVEEIKNFNAEVVTLRNLVKEMDENTNEYIFNRVINNLKQAQINYDNWFVKMQNDNNVITQPENKWNVDFNRKLLQLIE